ncbi:MAG: monovalent cation/H+ antiporter complex subunit F [Vicinamibacterales bacterium]
MSGVFLWATLVTLFLMMPFVSRVITGPTVFDRVVALNGLGTLVPAALVLVGLLYDRVDMFVDLALALFLLNVFTTLLIARYVRERAEAK